MLCRPAAMAVTSGAAIGSSSGDVLPDIEQNENSDDEESGDESQENARKRKKYTCVFRKEHAMAMSYRTSSKMKTATTKRVATSRKKTPHHPENVRSTHAYFVKSTQ